MWNFVATAMAVLGLAFLVFIGVMSCFFNSKTVRETMFLGMSDGELNNQLDLLEKEKAAGEEIDIAYYNNLKEEIARRAN